jgi:hypothetical protein
MSNSIGSWNEWTSSLLNRFFLSDSRPSSHLWWPTPVGTNERSVRQRLRRQGSKLTSDRSLPRKLKRRSKRPFKGAKQMRKWLIKTLYPLWNDCKFRNRILYLRAISNSHLIGWSSAKIEWRRLQGGLRTHVKHRATLQTERKLKCWRLFHRKGRNSYLKVLRNGAETWEALK